MLRIREQLLRRLVLLDLAVVDEDDAVGHLAGEAHFVGDHQHGDAGVCQGLSLVLMIFILLSMALIAKYDKEGEGNAF